MNNSAQAQKPSTLNPQLSTVLAWFCLRTHSRHEHIAGDWLTRYLGIQTYAPRIRFRQPERRGLVWRTDPLFPNYLFARFDVAKCLQEVEAAPGIRRVVRFGAHCPRIPDEVIQDLRATIGAEPVHVIDDQLHPGETIQVAGGVFHGLQAVVARVMPGRERIAVLLDFLGRQTMVELASAAVSPVGDERRRVFQ